MHFQWDPVLSCLILLSWIVTAEMFYVTPSSNTSCSRDPCYTLTDVVQNPAQYFASNTVITFLPGHHQTNITGSHTVLIKNVRNISMIGADHTNKLRSVVHCTGLLGFAFVNVTTLKIMKLVFFSCGAYYLTVTEKFLYPHDDDKAKIPFIPAFTLYFLHTVNITVSEVAINNSTGTGLLGINMLGVSNISQTTFSGNKANCMVIFLDIPITLQVISPTVLNLTDSQISFGSNSYYRPQYGTGLTIVLAQTTYNVHIYINNIRTSAYTGMQRKNLHTVIENWLCHCSLIQAKHIATTNTPGSYDVLKVRTNYGDKHLHNCTCLSETVKHYMVHISDSHFVGMEIWVQSNKKYGGARLLLQNITMQNCTQPSLPALLIKRLWFIDLQDMKIINCSRGMLASNSNITVRGTNYFHYNTGNDVFLLVRSVVSFHGATKFSDNKVKFGSTVVSLNSTIIFYKRAQFVENEGKAGGAIALYESSCLVFWKQSRVIFLRNHVEQNGGAILADTSSILVQSYANISFMENKGYNGGGLALQNGPTITLGSHSQMIFIRNHAQHHGGGLHISNTKKSITNFQLSILCFYQTQLSTSNESYLATSMPRLLFQNNTANFAGSSIYGGWVDVCSGTNQKFDTIFHFKNASQKLSTVSSDPTRVCVCINDIPDCNITHYNVTAYPGETFQIPAVAVGQRFGTVPFTVHARFTSVNSSSPPQMKTLQETQKVRRKCTNLTYAIFSSNHNEDIMLGVNKITIPYQNAKDSYMIRASRSLLLQFTDLHVHILLHACPLGFVLHNSLCTCHPQLQHHAINCSIETQKVNRPLSMWINGTLAHTIQNGILVHEHCPFDYCKLESLDLDLKHPDEQCAFSRSGILCGKCQHNLSHVFGTSACRECSSTWILLLVPIFALAGIALVVLLIVLNLTVSVGTINGLIFYANIVRANHATFFPPNTTNSFLSWFIAWINLDLGIETCFYNGLDAYVKTWLQFVFPLYIWFLVITIIVLSHYSTLAARLSGRNAVQVLATLFLLSYTKLLRIIITVLQSTNLEYPDNSVRKVWLYDGNVDYLKGKHIPLFIAALLLLFISLPYTAILIFIQHLQRWSSYRVLFWVKKMKPLFDAYTGPYKDSHRYWNGLLLLVRIVLFLVFSLNTRESADINLLAIAVTVLLLFMHGVLFGTIYKTWSLNVIEYSFFFNLGVLACATFYMTGAQQGQLGVVYASVSIALTEFIIIVTFHALKKLRSSHHCNRIHVNIVRKLRATRSALKKLFYKQKSPHQNTQPRVTHTRIELRESLLEYCS